MSKKIKILIADDHPLLTSGLKLAIDGWDDFTLTGIASNGKEAVELCEKDIPDVVLLDMQMPVQSGAEAAEIIKKRFPGTHLVALTTFYDAETVDSALKAGCDGFLLKTLDPDRLRASVYSILNGMSVIDGEAMEQLRKREAAHLKVDFSDREIKTLGYICNGMSNKEIAERLKLQPGTVKNMISMMLNKTFCVSRADLSRYAIEHHLVKSNT